MDDAKGLLFLFVLKSFLKKGRNHILKNVQYERQEALSILIISKSIENHLSVEHLFGNKDDFIS